MFWEEQEGGVDLREKKALFFHERMKFPFWPKQAISDRKEGADVFVKAEVQTC